MPERACRTSPPGTQQMPGAGADLPEGGAGYRNELTRLADWQARQLNVLLDQHAGGSDRLLCTIDGAIAATRLSPERVTVDVAADADIPVERRLVKHVLTNLVLHVARHDRARARTPTTLSARLSGDTLIICVANLPSGRAWSDLAAQASDHRPSLAAIRALVEDAGGGLSAYADSHWIAVEVRIPAGERSNQTDNA